VLQSEKFDPNGIYLRTWIPELTTLPNKYIHAPWQAPASILEKAGISLGKDYPQPIVDLKQTRERALNHYKKIRAPG
jgi:deoxyribodipyrimidine photo-lyase